MPRKRKAVEPPQTRDPVRTRAAILAAARELLAREGRDALNVRNVAELAGVNRGTAYLHFASREELTLATLEDVSRQLSQIAFLTIVDDEAPHPEEWLGKADELARFAMENPTLGQIWLNYILSSDRVKSDPFWLKWMDATRAIVESRHARPGIDAEVLAVMLLSSYFVWPTWAQAHYPRSADRPTLAQRLSKEVIRLISNGVLGAGATEKPSRRR
ncbi:MAG TPA: TetR/AcrR family transcriptional regulator [Nevskiaceae bacterium]|nr:TetR/AcrR family transcriptional regulator [Nevskiaceae bacterium]